MDIGELKKMTDFKNENELLKHMSLIISRAIGRIILRMAADLKKQILEDVYYEDYFPNQMYFDDGGRPTGSRHPTWEFLNSWDTSPVINRGNEIYAELFFNPKKLSLDTDKWKHGSPISGDARDNLADILDLAFNNYQAGYTSGLMVGDRHMSKFRKPYWENFIKNMFDKGQIEEWFIEELEKEFNMEVI